MTTAALFDSARDAITARGFDPEIQTRIALFLGATKNINLALLAASELMPATSAVYAFTHGQLSRELEFSTLLARVTRWSMDPTIYMQAATVVAPLWKEWYGIKGPVGAFDSRSGYRGLAFGHALLARVRLTPVIPATADDLDPFVVAIRRIEQENGRMIQAQIRLLKDMPVDLSLEEREQVVEDEQVIVDEAFSGFLELLARR